MPNIEINNGEVVCRRTGNKCSTVECTQCRYCGGAEMGSIINGKYIKYIICLYWGEGD